MERLQKVMAEAGIASRRKSEEYIVEGRVKVNGVVVSELGTKVSEDDYIEVDDKPIRQERKVYILMNKPRNCVTTVSDDRNRPTVMDHLKNVSTRVYPVGRLDYDTTGVLLLTNDGEFANILMHPSSGVEKVYVAKLNGIIKGEQINKLKDGVMLDDELVKASRVKLKKVDPKSNSSMVQITINEGKNHQVKRMFEAVGFLVDKLKREKEGFFDLKDLQSGEFRKLTPKEVAKVYGLKK